MSATTIPAPAQAAPAEPKKKGKLPLIVAVVLVLALGGGAYFFLFKKSDTAAEAKPEPTPGVVVDLEPLTLNLADGRYLKIGLSLEVTEEANAAAGKEGFKGAKARDAAIEVLGAHTYSQMLLPKTREAVLGAMTKEIVKRYDGDVMHVYVTDFVMQ